MFVIKKIKPMFTAIVTTMNKYEQDSFNSSGIIDVDKQQGTVKEYQTVIEVGPNVQHIKVGDVVCINPSRFAVKKYQDGSMKDGVISVNQTVGYNFPIVTIDGKQYLLIQDRDVDFIIEEYEDMGDPEPSKIIKPAEKKIIIN